jgi:hypothetical protein
MKKPIIHIFHSGKKAEHNYFVNFGHLLGRDAEIVVKSYPFQGEKNGAPWQVVDRALKAKKEISKNFSDQIWCVFDVDDYWKQNKSKFEESLKKAKKNGIKIAHSNECWELWLLLHFDLIETEISRKDYGSKLKKSFRNLDFDYEKNSDGVFEVLLKLQQKAIQNSKKIFTNGRVDKNPSNSVFQLVEELNKFLPR